MGKSMDFVIRVINAVIPIIINNNNNKTKRKKNYQHLLSTLIDE